MDVPDHEELEEGYVEIDEDDFHKWDFHTPVAGWENENDLFDQDDALIISDDEAGEPTLSRASSSRGSIMDTADTQVQEPDTPVAECIEAFAQLHLHSTESLDKSTAEIGFAESQKILPCHEDIPEKPDGAPANDTVPDQDNLNHERKEQEMGKEPDQVDQYLDWKSVAHLGKKTGNAVMMEREASRLAHEAANPEAPRAEALRQTLPPTAEPKAKETKNDLGIGEDLCSDEEKTAVKDISQ